MTKFKVKSKYGHNVKILGSDGAFFLKPGISILTEKEYNLVKGLVYLVEEFDEVKVEETPITEEVEEEEVEQEEEVEESNEEFNEELSSMYSKDELKNKNKAELKRIAKEFGLDASGTKTELIDKILSIQ